MINLINHIPYINTFRRFYKFYSILVAILSGDLDKLNAPSIRKNICVSFGRNISKVYILAYRRILSCIQEFQMDHLSPHPL